MPYTLTISERAKTILQIDTELSTLRKECDSLAKQVVINMDKQTALQQLKENLWTQKTTVERGAKLTIGI